MRVKRAASHRRYPTVRSARDPVASLPRYPAASLAGYPPASKAKYPATSQARSPGLATDLQKAIMISFFCAPPASCPPKHWCRKLSTCQPTGGWG
eukprot:3829275-Rhodomonas_salina.1